MEAKRGFEHGSGKFQKLNVNALTSDANPASLSYANPASLSYADLGRNIASSRWITLSDISCNYLIFKTVIGLLLENKYVLVNTKSLQCTIFERHPIPIGCVIMTLFTSTSEFQRYYLWNKRQNKTIEPT